MPAAHPPKNPRRARPIPPPAAEFLQARLHRLREAMHKAKAPALLVTSFTDVSWLTGFEGDDSFALVTPEKVLLISDSRYEEQISREAPWVTSIMRKKSIWDAAARQIKRLKLPAGGRLAVQSESLTLRGQATLREALEKLRSPTKFAAVADLIVNLRHIKDEHEIAIIEDAIRIAEDAFLAVKQRLAAGRDADDVGTENDVAGLLGYEMRKRGALNSSFDSIVAAGPNGSLPHYRPGDVRIERDSPLLIDWGARHRGYCSDLTRVLFLGRVGPKIREIYQIVLEAQLAAIAAIKPGAHGKKVDAAARAVITKAGYGKHFGHGTGHGIGRDIHEPISLAKLSTTTLRPGMIVTVEPGIYLPGIGGVRIEDDILVTPSGARVLSRLPKDLASAAV